MATYEVTTPDGETYEITAPDDATEAQIKTYVETQRRKPASVTAGENLRQIPRQLGLAARYGLEAFGQTALPDLIGLPEPRGANERVIADASRNLIMAAPIAKGAAVISAATRKAAPVVSAIANTFTQNMAGQATGAVGAGLAGGSVREAGGGPTEQFIASLVGGVGGGLAGGPVARRALSTEESIKAIRSGEAFKPKEIQAEVKVALERAGIDWQSLSKGAQEQLVKDARAAVYGGEPLRPEAVRRLADFRNIGATPLVGDITQDPRQLTLQRNLSKQQANTQRVFGPDLPGIEEQNTKAVLSTLRGSADSPDDAFMAGQRIIGSVADTDAAAGRVVSGLYDDARAAAGRDIPLNRSEFVNRAWANLAKTNKTAFLPAEIESQLNQISQGQITRGGKTFDVPFNVDVVDQLKTTLATASRRADGNQKAAIAAVRDALENLDPKAPIVASPGDKAVVTSDQAAWLRSADSTPPAALAAADKARAASRSRFNWQESAKFIEDALGGAEPDKFIQKHVISGPVSELVKIRQQIGADKETVDSVRKQMIDYILARGNVRDDVNRIAADGLTKGFEAIGERKLAVFFSPEELAQIRSAVNVARYIQAQPAGSAVNNSNTAAMIVGKLASLLTASSGVPVWGNLFAQPLVGVTTGIQARQVSQIPNSLVAMTPREQIPYNQLALIAAAAQSRNDNGGN